MFEIDTNTEFGQRVMDRLGYERIGWLVTVGSDGTPQPSPIWFLWQNESMLIYSRPNTAKLRNIERNPSVAVHLEGNGRGGDIVIFTGVASVDPDSPAAVDVSDFNEKYRSGIMSLGMSPQGFSDAYSVAIRFNPKAVRGH